MHGQCMVRSTKLSDLSVYIPKGPEPVAVPSWCPPQPMVALFAGIRNSGKTTSIASMLRKMKDANVCHRVFLVSPTYESNKHTWEGLVSSGDVFEPTVASLDEVVARTEAEVAEWAQYVLMRDTHAKYKRAERDFVTGKLQVMDKDLIARALQLGVADLDKMPAYKWPGIQRPCLFLVVDDAQSSPLFLQSTKHKNGLAALCIRNRHIGGLEHGGLSIILSLQNWKSQTGTLSRAVRANLTCIALWLYRDSDLLKDIYSEIANDISEAQFYEAYLWATGESKKHFLFIEFGDTIRLRRCFDEFIDIESLTDGDAKDKLDALTEGGGGQKNVAISHGNKQRPRANRRTQAMDNKSRT
jgi:hypothetical protein